MFCELSTASIAITECALPHQPIFFYELHPVKDEIISRTETDFNEDQTILHRQ